MRYIDDFVLCFQYRADALRVQNALRKRLGKFGLELDPSKTKLVEFGRFAQRHACKRGRKRPETIYFLGITLYCTQNQKGSFKVGLRVEKLRLRRTLSRLRDHFAYHGIAGNLCALWKVHRFAERYWRKMLCSRSCKGHVPWEVFYRIKERFPLQRPKLRIPYGKFQSLAVR